ncbi:hypothetical protein D7M11_12600 [Paenibacillus ginsengarvi]|uniref:Uncharacterized protein n=1 Tax=Paenibacillus ginsengarvi TaxID=400777 RepID=A0A3B0CG02_9BACL|nr:hypothetical protein D7M11_12600 [Paenibacillus ginsengarvi]
MGIAVFWDAYFVPKSHMEPSMPAIRVSIALYFSKITIFEKNKSLKGLLFLYHLHMAVMRIKLLQKKEGCSRAEHPS